MMKRIKVPAESQWFDISITEDTDKFIEHVLKQVDTFKKQGLTAIKAVSYVKCERWETDEEYNKRLEEYKIFDAMSTEELLKLLKQDRYYSTTLKDVLSTREHIPTGKIEKKIVRQLKAKYGINETKELYELHAPEISKLVKEKSND